MLSLTSVRSLGKSHPKKDGAALSLSSALAYKFIRKLSQFKCPRCFNQGASPCPRRSVFRAHINNLWISFSPFRLSHRLSSLTLSYTTRRSLLTEISAPRDFRVGASNIKQLRSRAATSLGGIAARERGAKGHTVA